jgi:hypothetical protein
MRRAQSTNDLLTWNPEHGADKFLDDSNIDSGAIADRLSCHRFWANQFRLLLHAAAYWLLDTLRRWLIAAGVERTTLETLRRRLVKIGGWVREWRDQVRVRLATSHPHEGWWHLLAVHHPPS